MWFRSINLLPLGMQFHINVFAEQNNNVQSPFLLKFRHLIINSSYTHFKSSFSLTRNCILISDSGHILINFFNRFISLHSKKDNYALCTQISDQFLGPSLIQLPARINTYCINMQFLIIRLHTSGIQDTPLQETR